MAIPQHVSFTVAHLPTTEYGNRAPLWWAVVLAMAIEASVFALTLVTLLYLRLQETTWPPLPWAPPLLLFPTITTVLLLASLWPAYRIDLNGRALDQPKVKRMLVIFFLFSAALLVTRTLEFFGLRVKWDSNAYGSILWAVIILHSVHLLTSIAETGLLAAYVFLRPLDKKHSLDLQVTALYWYFVVGSWIPVYVLVYLGPYFLN